MKIKLQSINKTKCKTSEKLDWKQRLQICHFFFFNVFIFERDRVGVGEGHREGETQNWKQVPGSELSAQSPTWGSNSGTARS